MLSALPVAVPRRLPEPGNVSAATGWVLNGLSDSLYTWTVRAVDSAYSGGPAAEGVFGVNVPVSTEDDGELPRTYALEGNYPNPFNAATTIRYTLPEQADVTLEVYDILGRRVAQPVQDTRPAGFHEVRWEAAGLASGPYLVRFTAGTFTATRRILRLRLSPLRLAEPKRPQLPLRRLGALSATRPTVRKDERSIHPQEPGVDGDDDRREAHQHGPDGGAQHDASRGEHTGR